MFYHVRTCHGSSKHPNPRPPEQAKPPPLRDEPLGLHPAVHFISRPEWRLCTSMHVLNTSIHILNTSMRNLIDDSQRFSFQRAHLLDPSISTNPSERRARRFSWTARSEGEERKASRIWLNETSPVAPTICRISCCKWERPGSTRVGAIYLGGRNLTTKERLELLAIDSPASAKKCLLQRALLAEPDTHPYIRDFQNQVAP